jgi:hypothetical protein
VLTLDEYAGALAAVCLDREPSESDVKALAGDPARWLRYRRMVRRRLSDIVRATFPRLETAVGDPALTALEDGFFAARALASPLIRDVPGEFLGWARGEASLPAYALELAELEWTERVVTYAEDDDGEVAPLAMDAPVVLTRAHRLLAFAHAVHRFDPATARMPEATPTRLCVYRDPESHDVRVLETTAVTHELLEELSGGASLRASIARAAERTGVELDLPFLEALSDILADFSTRGLVRGARRSAPPAE